ncbi:hypothetical protein JOS77_06205 [Chromobacterium haemolyticum]|nr:hypothetical protein JOS77_06205 [Chromobacterium haemolyticum]
MKSTNATRQQLLDCGLIMAKEAGRRRLTARQTLSADLIALYKALGGDTQPGMPPR